MNYIKRSLLGLGGILTGSLSYAQEIQTLPNIIVILADDAGYADFGFMGSEDILSPNIDRLASNGVVCTDAHVSATVSAPSRAGLLSGRYQQRFGFECNIPPHNMGIDPGVKTIASVLKKKNYRTMAIGKWHVGEADPYHPNERGFDEFYGFLGGSRSYFFNKRELINPGPRTIFHNRKAVSYDDYLTDVFGDEAVRFIENCDDHPFFLYFAPNAVHTPMHARKDHLDKFKGHERQKLAAMTWSLDENVGKIYNKLNERGILGRTLVFFLSDNGGALFNQSSCYPLKGWKGNKYEGGHRVPFIVSWPDCFQGGKSFNGLISSFDIFATSLDAAGISSDKYLTDGVSLLPYMKGERKGNPHELLFWRKHRMAGMRFGQWKMIRLEDFGYRLYHLKEDPGESIDKIASEEIAFQFMKEQMLKWEEGLMDPLWVEDKQWQKVTYEIHQALMENRKPNYSTPAEMKRFFNEKTLN